MLPHHRLSSDSTTATASASAHQPIDQPLPHCARIKHGLRSGEGLGDHDHQGGRRVESFQRTRTVHWVHILSTTQQAYNNSLEYTDKEQQNNKNHLQ
jgi:hypothetical protein